MREIINRFLKNNKRLFIILILAIFIAAPNITQAQSAATKKAADKSWNAFWMKFSNVVKNKDRKGLIALTRKDFQDAGGGSIEEWMDSASWSRLRNSVNKGTKDYSHGREIGRITRNKDLIFIYGKNGWRFFGELVA